MNMIFGVIQFQVLDTNTCLFGKSDLILSLNNLDLPKRFPIQTSVKYIVHKM